MNSKIFCEIPREEILNSPSPYKEMIANLLKPPHPDTEVENLTDREKLALAYISGVEIESGYAEDKKHTITFRTKFPIGIAKVNGKFQVFVGRQE